MCLGGAENLCVSIRDYYWYRLQMRPRIFNPIFAVDAYIKLESSSLDYIKNNQQELRADLYQGLIDSLHASECRAVLL
jgi:hypothetical protein